MKNVIIRKTNRGGILNWYILECPCCFWFALWQEIFYLFSGLLGIPFLPPLYMPLREFFMKLRQIPFAHLIKRTRTVGITINNHHVIVVEVKAPWHIKDAQLLYALAVIELSHSPEMKSLPRFMAQEIRKRARHIHLASARIICAEAYDICEIETLATSKSAGSLPAHWSIRIKRVFVHRSLRWKGDFSLGVQISRSNFGSYLERYLEKNRSVLLHMHPVCARLILFLHNRSRLLSIMAACVFIAMEKRYPGLFGIMIGCRLLALRFFVAGLLLIIQNTTLSLCCLWRSTLQMAQGNQNPDAVLEDQKEGQKEDAADIPQDGSPQDLPEDRPELADPTADTTENTALASEATNGTEGIEDGKRERQAIHEVSQDDVPCNCGRLHTKKASKASSRPRMEYRCPRNTATSGPAEQKKAYSGDSAKSGQTNDDLKPDDNPTPGDVTPKGVLANPNLTTAVPTEAASNVYGAFAASYEKVTGSKAPLIVSNATATDNTKKSGKRRRINRYAGNEPALSVEAMIELFDLMFPGCFITDFVRAECKGDNDVIYIHSNKTKIPCPCCGAMNKRERDNNTRTVFDTTIRNGIGTQLELTLGRATCANPKCKRYRKTYVEECTFAPANHSHTTRVQFLSLVMCSTSSFHDTERQLKLMGIAFGDDRVKELLMSLKFSDEKDVRVIGMDDVATLKGQNYCTIIYNMENGHMLALIKGRSGKEFQRKLHEWLDQHPEVDLVCRDRSSAYGCYIDHYNLEHPERHILQVADRFHLLQNLSDHLYKAYCHEIPNLIALLVDELGATILDDIPKQVAVPVAPRNEALWDLPYTKDSQPLDEDGNPIVFDVYIDRMPDKKKIQRIEKNEKLYLKICQIRDEYKAIGCKFPRGKKKEFLEKHGISDYTFKKYINMSDEEVEAVKGAWKPSSRPKLFDEFKNVAYMMLRDGFTICDTFWFIRDVLGGWTQGDTTLMDYICATYKVVYPDRPIPLQEDFIQMKYPNDELVIGRTKLFYALMTYDEKKQDKDLAPHLDLICKKYPVCETIRSIAREFHDIIIVDEKISERTPEKCQVAVDNLQKFIAEHDKDADKLRGFARSLQSDLPCIINAITMPESSGGVEGRNNKMKYIKRMSYGHICLDSLEQKLKLGFMYTGAEFTFAEIVPWLVDSLEP